MKGSFSQIAKRYARATYELVHEKKIGEGTRTEAMALKDIVDEHFVRLFMSPKIGEDKKLEVLDAIEKELRVSEVMKGLIRLVYTNKRMFILKEILDELIILLNNELGVCQATLLSAQRTDAEALKDFEKALSAQLNKKVVLESKVDPSLIAGFKIQFGQTILDASLKTRMLRLAESLSQGA